MNVYSSFPQIHLKLEAAGMSFKRWVDKQMVVCLANQITQATKQSDEFQMSIAK